VHRLQEKFEVIPVCPGSFKQTGGVLSTCARRKKGLVSRPLERVASEEKLLRRVSAALFVSWPPVFAGAYEARGTWAPRLGAFALGSTTAESGVCWVDPGGAVEWGRSVGCYGHDARPFR
jgi:hypothetical protein